MRTRFTRDIDTLTSIPEADWAAALAKATAFGVVPRVEGPLDFARRTRVLLMRHEPTQIDIDVILGALPFEHEIIQRGSVHVVEGVTVRLPRVAEFAQSASMPDLLADFERLVKKAKGN